MSLHIAAKHGFTPLTKVQRIGLISPCLGNLGNAAIISATIWNIRKRIPTAEIVGITLSPEDTRRRHGIEAFPITGVNRPYYNIHISDGFTPRPGSPTREKAKTWAKRIPLLRKLVRAIRMVHNELSHIVAAASLVRTLDCVIISGGGALDEFWGGPWGHPWTLFKWSLLSRIQRAPFLFVSVGKCCLQHWLSRFFVRVALRLAIYRSYRDEESKIAVQSLINSPEDPVYPDLAFSFPSPTLTKSGSSAAIQNRLTVGVSPIAYFDPRVWPLKDQQRYSAYINQMAEMVAWLDRQGHRVLFFATDIPDEQTIREIQAKVSEGLENANAFETLTISPEESTNGLLQGICQADLIIASRLHGVILSHLIGIPVLALSYDPKVEGHMNAIGQGDHCLNVDHLQQDSLRDRFNALAALRNEEATRLRSSVLRFRQLLDLQYDRTLGPTKACSVASGVNSQIDLVSPFVLGKSQ